MLTLLLNFCVNMLTMIFFPCLTEKVHNSSTACFVKTEMESLASYGWQLSI